MKTISNSKDLAQQKMQLRIQQLEQEKAIRLQWNELKDDLKPGTFLRQRLAEFHHSNKGEESLLSGLVNYGTAYLSNRIITLAGTKIETALEQGIEKISSRLKKGWRNK